MGRKQVSWVETAQVTRLIRADLEWKPRFLIHLVLFRERKWFFFVV